MLNKILHEVTCCKCGRKNLVVQDRSGRCFRILKDDQRLLRKYWGTFKHRNTWYVRRVRYIGKKQSTILLHRIIANTSKGLVTDHLDGDGLNNCRCNLENVTSAENNSSRRRHVHLPNNTGEHNIHKLKKGGYQVHVNNQRVTASTLAEAIVWRDGLLNGSTTIEVLRTITKYRLEANQYVATI